MNFDDSTALLIHLCVTRDYTACSFESWHFSAFFCPDIFPHFLTFFRLFPPHSGLTSVREKSLKTAPWFRLPLLYFSIRIDSYAKPRSARSGHHARVPGRECIERRCRKNCATERARVPGCWVFSTRLSVRRCCTGRYCSDSNVNPWNWTGWNQGIFLP